MITVGSTTAANLHRLQNLTLKPEPQTVQQVLQQTAATSIAQRNSASSTSSANLWLYLAGAGLLGFGAWYYWKHR
jgi:LPXTG-motif cell wall-anchored protein